MLDDTLPFVVVTRRELEDSLARVRASVGDPRAGIHGPGSAAWRLQRESLLFLGGGRAALLQLAHPFVAYAIDQHSKTRADVVGRFQRTFDNVFAMSFGDLDRAFAAARRVHNVHTRITGTIPVDAGAFPAGTVYHANDASSLRWVFATLVHTAVQVREVVLGRLPTEVKEAYYQDSWQFARLFAIPEAMLPPTWAAFDRYVEDTMASPVLTVTDPAREMARFLFGRAATRPARIGRWVEAITAGLLPDRLRRDYGLAWGLGERAAFHASIAALGPVWRMLPRRARLLPAYVDAERRAAGHAPSALARWMDRRLSTLATLATGQ
jgi:uncharacterized protein (DUF2236 family)